MSGSEDSPVKAGLGRREFLSLVSSLGVSSTVFSAHLWAHLQEEQVLRIDTAIIREAEKLAGLEFTEEQRELMLEGVNRRLEGYEKLRRVTLANHIPPALRFDPVLPGMSFPSEQEAIPTPEVEVATVPADLEEMAFWSVTRLAALIRSRGVTSEQLTRMYLQRLKRYGPKLECIVTLTEELALLQARKADQEIQEGRYRGPLHGIPWGAKDLLAVRDYPTTWGTQPYRHQVIDEDATVVRRLAEAGAVLLAKLTLGELAWGDVWFGGKTRNPWNPEEGSSGSSAGSAAATSAGLVGFSIGSETYGSIVSPCTRCGVSGLRPTFGRVSRHGAMALSWSMDKIGPICRTVEDCALVFHAICGADGKDPTAIDFPFNWDPGLDLTKLRIGYVKSAFDEERENAEWKAHDNATLERLLDLGIRLVRVELPDYPVEALSLILNVEAAAAFDELTRTRLDQLMVRQERNAWPNVFRYSRLIPAVEYLQANRVRTLVMGAMARLMENLDVYVCPSFEGNNLLLTNLTGHPAVVVPNGFTSKGTPTSITFVGRLYGEAEVLAVARAYQEATGFHLLRPELVGLDPSAGSSELLPGPWTRAPKTG